MSFFGDDDQSVEQEDKDLKPSKTKAKTPKSKTVVFTQVDESESEPNSFVQEEEKVVSSSINVEQDASDIDESFTEEIESAFTSPDEDLFAINNNDGNAATKGKFVKSKIPAGTILVYLLKSYIDREDQPVLYDALIKQQFELDELCSKLYVRLVIDDQAGYAYLKSMDEEEISTNSSIRPPQLLNRRQLSFFPSFILILLRKSLLDFEVSGMGGRLVMEPQEILNLVKVYFPNVNNEKNLDDRINRGIEELLKLGLLARQKIERGKTKIERLEVKRIINAIVTPDVLKNADDLLANYVRVYNESKDGIDQDI